jgi:hypothetical protein
VTAKAVSVANWLAAIALAMTGAGACGTAVWQFASLSTKVDAMNADIAYIKGRIDGAPPTPKPPLTTVIKSSMDCLGRTASRAR